MPAKVHKKHSALTEKILSLYSIAFLIVGYYFFLFHYSFTYNFQPGVTGFYYSFVFFAFYLLGFAYSRLAYKSTVELHFFDIIMLVLFFLLIVCICTDSPGLNLHNEVLCNAGAMMVIYFIARQLPDAHIDKYLLPVLLLFFVYEIWLGIRDVYYNYNKPDLLLLVNGSLKNAGIYSIYLTVHIPVLSHYLDKAGAGKWTKVIIMSAIILLVGYLLFITQSRISMICLSAIIGIFIFRNTKRLNSKPVAVIISLLLLVFLYFVLQGLIDLRPGSVSGRYLIWKITLKNLWENVWFGVGYGNFYRNYPSWQIQYFEQLPLEKLSEGLHADDISVAFNEPLQLLAETGIAGVGIGIVLMKAFFSPGHMRRDKKLFWLRITLIIMIVSSFTSYTFHVTAILFLFVLLLAYLSTLAFKKTVQFASKWFSVFMMAGALLMLTKSVAICGRVAEWNAVQYDPLISADQRLQSFKRLYPYLKNNGKFLLDYGENLYLSKHADAVKILEESKNEYISIKALELLGDAYNQQGDMLQSIKNHEELVNLIPYKFAYKNTLLGLYMNAGDTTNAKRMANMILKMPVKKESSFIERIKQDMDVFLRTR